MHHKKIEPLKKDMDLFRKVEEARNKVLFEKATNSF